VSVEERLVAALAELGFSGYEAKTYTGLLNGYGQTAYALSKTTKVPQPKIYEALRKLESRGAAVLVDTHPQRFAATPPDVLLARIQSDFDERLSNAASEAAGVLSMTAQVEARPETFAGIYGKPEIIDAAISVLAKATDKVYISGWIPDFEALAPAIADAEDRGVLIIALIFGRGRFTLRNGQLYRHNSTSKIIYPHHQNRHLALVADGKSVVWSLAVEDDDWSGLAMDDRRLVGLVRSFIRHDIYVQKMYSRFGPELTAVFGEGLELLADVSSDLVRDAIVEPKPAKKPRSKAI
jgi:HTH-type transcriptional regulator, sugar sensing transcriptional regulator